MCTAVPGVGPLMDNYRHHNRSMVVKISPIGETESHPFYNVFMVWLSDMIFNGIRQTPGNFIVYADLCT